METILIGVATVIIWVIATVGGHVLASKMFNHENVDLLKKVAEIEKE